MRLYQYTGNMNEQVCNIKFVKLVQKHPCLYNQQLPQYSRKDITEKAWNDVANKMNITATACKEKWRNVRSVFLRHIKSSTSVRSHKKMKPYYLFDTMQFLIPYTKVPVSPQNETTPEISYELKHESEIETESSEHHEHENLPQYTSDTLTSSRKQNSKKRAIDDVLIRYLNRKISDGENISNENTRKREAIKMFLLSLIPELEELSDAQMKIFKRRVLHLIDDISSNHISTPSIYLPMAQAASSLHP